MDSSELKFSAPDWCFFREGADPAEYYARLADAGCTAAEMVAPERRAAAKDAGLLLLNACGEGMVDGFNVRANRDPLIDANMRLVDSLSSAGVRYLIVFSGCRKEGVSDEEAFDNCLEAFSRLLDKSRGSGVGLQFEMLNAKDHAGYQADHEDFGFRLARELDDPDFSVLYDIYHMEVSGDCLLDGLAAKLPRISHFHVAGLRGRGFPSDDNGTDYRGILRAIPGGGYHGFIGMEFLPKDDPLKELAEAVSLFRSY